MRVLIAFDGSPPSFEAVDEVERRPWPRGTHVRVIAVVTPQVPGASEFVPGSKTPLAVVADHERDARKLATHAADRLSEKGLATDAVARQGDPATAIIDEAKEWLADLIVVGSHGRKGLQRLVLGSVAQRVVADAPCSVEVVRRQVVAA